MPPRPPLAADSATATEADSLPPCRALLLPARAPAMACRLALLCSALQCSAAASNARMRRG
eukprot:m.191261 g.191261  ORF g.191261 m.191261 type:complete len:61 (+) comp17565_c1_seq55:157-339(+)